MLLANILVCVYIVRTFKVYTGNCGCVSRDWICLRLIFMVMARRMRIKVFGGVRFDGGSSGEPTRTVSR